MNYSHYKPRNDFVLIEQIKLDTVGGLVMPDHAIEGKEYHVRAMGPKVEGLSLGDKVLMIGTTGQDYAPLPGNSKLMIIKEANVVLIIGDEK